MKPDEAIKELQNWNGQTFETRFVTFSKAKELGIEALKRLEDWRAGKVLNPDLLLPGETE